MPALPEGPLLVRLPNWLGDLVLAWPVVEAAARVGADFAGPASFESIVAPRILSSRYVSVDRARPWSAVAALRARRPRATLLLTDSLSSAWIAWLAGIPCRIGHAAEGRGLFLTHRVPRLAPARSAPRLAEYRVLAEETGILVIHGRPCLRPLEVEQACGKEMLDARGVKSAYVVLAPGAAYGPAKQWGVDRFAEAGRAVALARGVALVVVGSGADRGVTRRVVERLHAEGVAAHDLAGATGLRALIGVLAGSAGVVSNDSGVMHLAAALGVPTVGLFGSTSPVWTAEQAPWVENLFAGYPCAPCYRRTCPIGYGCLRAIGTTTAASALTRLMDRAASEGGAARQRATRV